MKILFVLENYLPHIGGVEVLFKNLSEGLTKLGHDVTIITHRLKGTKKSEIINGVKVRRVSCFHSRYWFTFLSIPALLREAKDADIIHATMFNAAFPAWLAARVRKKPCILTVTEVWIRLWSLWSKLGEMGWLSAKMHDVLERAIYLLPYDRYVCISKSTQKKLLLIGIKKNKTEVIYPGIDYNLFNPKKYSMQKIRKKLGLKNNFVYMFYGRPGVSKGLEYLIKAVPIIAKKIPTSKLLAIVSRDKAYQKRYALMLRLIKELKIQGKIMLLDPVPWKELPYYLKAANCVIVPSLTEGFGFTAAEACAMQKPVVASNTTSLPEVVSGKYILVKPKSAEAIAEGIEAVYKRKVKSKGKKIFRWSDNIQKHLKIYKELKLTKK